MKSFIKTNNPGRILLGPGPSMADPRVLSVLSQPLIGHLDPQILNAMAQVQELLRFTFETKNELTLAVPGTGSAAMETAVANMVEADTSIFVCQIGYFGDRIAEMARLYGADVNIIQKPMGESIDPEEVRTSLKQKPAQIVAIVQGETSTGVLQPIMEISEIVHKQGGMLIVDAVTTLGGVPVSVDENYVDVCYSCSQKCLGCPPGISPITFSTRAVKSIESRKTQVPNWYLDINRLRDYWGEQHIYHHTASSTLVFALAEGLRIIHEEGLKPRFDRHMKNARLLWQGLEELGLELLIPETMRLPTLTTVKIPAHIDDQTFRKQLLDRFNIEISGGLGDLKGKVWRIGLMGFSSSKENVQLLLDALNEFL